MTASERKKRYKRSPVLILYYMGMMWKKIALSSRCHCREFFQLIGKHFPPLHRLHKIINRNSIKMICSCMPNIGDIIMHNKAILHQTDRKTQTVDKLCNYRNPSTCSLKKRCKEGPIMYKATLTLQNIWMVCYGGCETQLKSRTCSLKRRCKEGPIVYKATLTLQNITMVYYGSCETEFKIRYNNHKQSFKLKDEKHAQNSQKHSEMSKDVGETPLIEWSIAKRVPPNQYSSKTYQLCLAEKVTISQADKQNLLNKQSELVYKYCHINKFLLKSLRLKHNFCR